MDYKKVLTELGLYHINLEENTPQKPPHNFNPYYWWRRFGTHETLKASSHVLEKAKNGDFDASPYWKQIRYEYYYLVKDVLELRKKIGYVDKIQERDLVLSYNKRIGNRYFTIPYYILLINLNFKQIIRSLSCQDQMKQTSLKDIH